MIKSTFSPTPPPKKSNTRRNIKLELEPDHYVRLQDVATKHGISLKELVRQMVDFAEKHYDR